MPVIMTMTSRPITTVVVDDAAGDDPADATIGGGADD